MLGFLGCLLALVLGWPIRVLVVTAEQGSTVFVASVNVGEEISVEYTHSVERTPVANYFRVTAGNKLMLTRVRLASFGAGLPEFAPGVRHSAEWVELYGFNKEYAKMVWNVRGELDHALVLRGQARRLDTIVDNHSNIVLYVAFRPLVVYWLKFVAGGG